MTKKITIILIIIILLFLIVFLFVKNRKDESLVSFSDSVSSLNITSDLDNLIDKTKDKKYVLLGESSHGTYEYYKWRAEITKRLINENNFSYIAIEGDWPYIYNVNLYVKQMESSLSSGKEALLTSERWPEWMWANKEFLELVEWLHEYNKELPMQDRVGLYGMDMQNLNKSINMTLKNLEHFDNELSQEIKYQYQCFKEFEIDLISYAESYFLNQLDCKNEINLALEKLKNKYSSEEILNSKELFNIKQNMLAVKYGEKYARDMIIEGPYSWNTRVSYMERTVDNLSKLYGDESKGIIWAHNTHVGDARATEMFDFGMINIGQLLREKNNEKRVFILGFGTYEGSLIASENWGEERKVTKVPPAIPESIENFFRKLKIPSFIVFFEENNLPEILLKRTGHRAKGVVYNPDYDQHNYVKTLMSQRYDAFVFIKKTTALNLF